MVLVQLHNTGESRWLPYENLVRLRDANIKYRRAEAPETDSRERFRLKALAYALDSWNQITGALDRLDVDPLPHQIDLVHRIMTSDQSNWLIADDVGLGKTIEVGLLLKAMKRRRQARRVLVVCPAGMVRQWQDEMKYKFNEDFEIYGLDFNINHASRWTTHEKVIVSIDRAKTDHHSPIFNDSGDWDVIVFDEAHHLTKAEGFTAQRYRLAERLQLLTDAFIFLTGTPHQGKTDQFVNLLVLLRPDLVRRFANMFTDPSVVAEVVLRNRKSLVTDANGKFIFRGQDTHLVEATLSAPARNFDILLQEYLRNGYAASEAGGNTGRAVGFVMTTYRKLASSSIAAIELALQRRMARLRGIAENRGRYRFVPALEEMTEAFQEGTDGLDDLEDVSDGVAASNTGTNPFFHDEQSRIAELLTAAKKVKDDDRKLRQFLEEIVDPLQQQGERLLVFTEYRATQDYLVEALRRRYPNSGIAQINGSMSLGEKRSNIDEFNENAMFMVSTEAGGEGINLHERCHILLNYDLPWNPRRLMQRAGRLYRYGQQERVIVFNLMADDGFDNKALGMMLRRVFNIAQDMAEVGSEFREEGLQTEIIGDLLERVDIASILADNRTMDLARTEDEIEEAIARAKEAKSQQEKLFSHIEGYDPREATALYTFGPEEVLSFLEGILPYMGVRIRNRLYNGRVLELELPEEMQGRYSEFPERATFVRVTVDRQLVIRNSRLVPMDFASVFFSDLIEFAKSPEFKGEYASLPGPESGAIGIYKVRWQNDQGVPRWETLLPVFLPDGQQRAVPNPSFFGSLLLELSENQAQPYPINSSERQKILSLLDKRAHHELANRCTALRHPNDVVLLASADLTAV
jgi:ERCC4-related helicase